MMVAVVGVALAGAGYAMMGEDHVMIHACYHSDSGQLRPANEAGECDTNESPISWAQAGAVEPAETQSLTSRSGLQGDLGPGGPLEERESFDMPGVLGPPGRFRFPRFYVRASTFSDLAPGRTVTLNVPCNPGDVATGGGVGVFSAHSTHEVQALFATGHPEPSGWSARVKNIGTDFGGFTVSAVCLELRP